MRWTLLAAMAAWGVNMSVVKVLTQHFDSVTLNALRMGLAAATLGLIVWRLRIPFPTLGLRHVLGLLACGALLTYGYQMLLVVGLESTTATNASLTVALTPIGAALLGALHQLRLPGAVRCLGTVLGAAGVAMIVLHRPDASGYAAHSGDAIILMAVACWALGGELIQFLASRMHPMLIAALTHGIGAVMLVLHGLLNGEAPYLPTAADAFPWLLLAFSGVVSAALGNFVWYQSTARIGTVRTTPAINLVPVFGVGFAVAALSEPFSVPQAFATILVIAGSHLAMRQ